MLMRGEAGARDEARGLACVMLAERAGLREVAADPEARLPAPSARTEVRWGPGGRRPHDSKRSRGVVSQ
jgi:hypothetical protein